MRKVTVSLPDELNDALEEYRDDQTDPPLTPAVLRAALREYLQARGYAGPRKVLRITPATLDDDGSRVGAGQDHALTASHP